MYNYQRINKLIEELKYSKKDITVEKVAQGIGMSLSTLNKLKSGSSVPGVETLETIAKYFGVDMNYFFDDMVSEPRTVVTEPVPEYGKRNPWELLYEKQEEITELKCEIERLKNVCAHGNGAKAG